jgi:hypothetical protein
MRQTFALLTALAVLAQAAAAQSAEDLAKKPSSPISSLISVQFKCSDDVSVPQILQAATENLAGD